MEKSHPSNEEGQRPAKIRQDGSLIRQEGAVNSEFIAQYKLLMLEPFVGIPFHGCSFLWSNDTDETRGFTRAVSIFLFSIAEKAFPISQMIDPEPMSVCPAELIF